MRRIAVIAIASLAGACYSDVPLDRTPSIRVNSNLVGDWACPDSKDPQHVARLKVKAIDKYRYFATWQEKGQKDEKYVAYASSVGGSTLFNVQLVPPGSSRWWDHPWAFVALRESSGTLQIQLVADEVIKRSLSPEELRSSLAQAMGRSDFFDEHVTVCQKRK